MKFDFPVQMTNFCREKEHKGDEDEELKSMRASYYGIHVTTIKSRARKFPTPIPI
jgi:hypothetical protein